MIHDPIPAMIQNEDAFLDDRNIGKYVSVSLRAAECLLCYLQDVYISQASSVICATDVS